MAHTVGIASDYLNLFQRLRRYLTGYPSVEDEVANPANDGDGYLRDLMPDSSSLPQTWTLTCTTGGGDGVAIFSVVGSTSGTQDALIAGLPYKNSFFQCLMRIGPTNWTIGDSYTFSIVSNSIPGVQQWTELKYVAGVPQGYSGAGGYFDHYFAKTAAPTETWTVQCDTAGSDLVPATFTVTGSVSGVQANATAGTAYSNAFIEFEIFIDYDDHFIQGTLFYFDVENVGAGVQPKITNLLMSNPRGTNNGMNVDAASNATYPNELFLKGPGLAGADDIHVNLITYYDDAADYYNLGFCGTLGFETDDTWAEQPVKSTDVSCAAWQFQIPYWFRADGRHFILSFKISTNYMSTYCGWFLPYATPGEYPYPMYICSALNGFSGTRWSSESQNHRSFFDPYAGYVYKIDGTWRIIQNKYASGNSEVSPGTSNLWPYTQNLVSGIRQSPGDTYPMLPMVLHTDQDGGNVYGELPDCFWVPGFANASENVVVVGGFDHMVIQDVYRTSNQDYYALKLD